jgi:hypothetical protein
VGINNNPSRPQLDFGLTVHVIILDSVDQGGTFTSVNDPNVPGAGPTTAQLFGVNDSNIAAGFYTDAMGNNQGFEYNIDPKTFTPVTLPASFNAVMTTVTGINDG